MSLINRTSSRAMGAGNMKRALKRIALEWDAILQEAPPDCKDIEINAIRYELFHLTKRTAFLWGTSSPIEYGPQDTILIPKR